MKKINGNFRRKISGALLLLAAVFALAMCGGRVQAAEFSVTPAEAVLYTNGETIIFLDADEETAVLSGVAEGLPIQVTGITSNGYFQILLDGQIFYVNGAGLCNSSADEEAAAAADIYARIIAQKAVFPEGMRWTNENYYAWNGGIYRGGFGCAGFAFAVSDAAFGDAQATIHTDYDNIRVGDILRINNDTHSVIVLEVKEDSVIVAEGNYNSSIHWGREIPKSSLQGAGNYIMTRY